MFYSYSFGRVDGCIMSETHRKGEKNIDSYFLKRPRELPNNAHNDSDQSEEEEAEEPQSEPESQEHQQAEVRVRVHKAKMSFRFTMYHACLL